MTRREVTSGLPAGPDATIAWSEISTFGGHETQIRLSAQAQTELAGLYQHARHLEDLLGQGDLSAADARRARREIERTNEGLGWLMRSLEGLIVKVVGEAARRLGGRAQSEIDDLRSDGTVSAIEAIGTFDPAKGSTLAGWVADTIRRRCADNSVAGLPRDWRRVARLAAGILPYLVEELGREPTRAELQAAILDRCRQRTEERLSDEEKTLGREERDALVHARLRKSSMLRAIEELDAVLQASSSTISLNAPVHDGDSAFGDLLVDDTECSVDEVVLERIDGQPERLADVLWGGAHEQAVAMVLARTGLEAGDPQTIENVAEQFGVERADVRRALKDTTARAVAPHAQFAHLDPDVPGAFDPAVTESVATLLARRRARREPDRAGTR